MNHTRMRGLIAAPFTPMKKDGSINPENIRKYASYLKNNGLSGVFSCGTTGEGMLMTIEERKIISEHWIAEQSDSFKIIVHVGTTSSSQSKELAQHAQEAGAYAVGCMGPVFLKPSRIEELIHFCADVAVGASKLPFYYYHIPSISGVELSMPEFLQKAQNVIPNLAGIKFTHRNMMELSQCISADEGKWDILHGLDEELLPGLSIGIEGAVGSTYNYLAPLYQKLIDAFQNSDMQTARFYQGLSLKFIDILNRFGGGVVGGKPLMKLIGIDCGPLRPPAYNLSDIEISNYLSELKDVEFFDWGQNKNKKSSIIN